MEIITGRLTDHAQVKTLKDGRQLVVFTVAVNESYKPKDGKRVEATNFFNCSYWLTTAIAKSLTKSSIVSVCGHIGINAYETKNHEFKANLTFHANTIKLIAKGTAPNITNAGVPMDTQKDDMPF